MEHYKIYLLSGLFFIVITLIIACSGINPLIPGVLFITGTGLLVTGWQKGKNSIFQIIEEDRQLTEGLERGHKIQITVDTIGCTRDEAIVFLKSYNWDEIKIFLEFRNCPERFYNARIDGAKDGKTCSRCGTICPSNVTFCVNCESILKKVKDTMNLRKDMLSERPCPSCNSMCPQNYNVCPHCNYILNPDFNTEVPVKTYEKRCAGCGAICNSSLPYCPSCEKPLEDMRETAFIEAVTAPVPVNKCPACGNICAANLKYCTECGKNL